MKFGRYLRAAIFNPLNLLVVAGAVIAGLVFKVPQLYWPVVAGVEAAFVLGLAATPGFQRYINGRDAVSAGKAAEENAVMGLKGEGQGMLRKFKQTCGEILGRIQAVSPGLVEMHQEELAKLAGVYLQLLTARQSLRKTLEAAGAEAGVDEQVKALDLKLADAGISAELKTSVEAEREILVQRKAALEEGQKKLVFVESEIRRVDQQVKLLRDQLMVSATPQQMSEKIAEISATLKGTTQWVGLQAGDEAAPKVTLDVAAVRQ